MIQTFVNRFMAGKDALAERFTKEHPSSYADIVKAVVEAVTNPEEYGDFNPDADRIHSIDDGEYQGTLVFVIAAKGYQPSTYWYVKVGYGSCSGCDTLEGLRCYSDDAPSTDQVEGYLTLALHIVQGLRKMGEEEA